MSMIHPEDDNLNADPKDIGTQIEGCQAFRRILNLIRFDFWCQFTKRMICLESTLNGKHTVLCIVGLFGYIAYVLILITTFLSSPESNDVSVERFVPSTVFGTMAFLHICSAGFSSCPSNTTSSVFGATVSTIAFISHIMHALKLVPYETNSFGRQISLIQYGEWVICVPLMVMVLGHILCVDCKYVCCGALVQLFCLLIAFVASLVPNQACAGFLLFFATVLLLPFLFIVYILCFKLSDLISSTQTKKIQFLGLCVLVLWNLYPVVVFCGLANLISDEAEHNLLMYCDLMSKAFFLAIMMVYKFEDTLLKHATRLVILQKEFAAQKLFLRFVFHEVRVPFHSLFLGLEHLKEEMKGDTNTQLVDALTSAAKMMNRVINDVLCLSRLQDGRLIVRPEKFSLDNMFKTTANSFQEMAKAKGVELKTQCDIKLPPFMLGDEQRITQILANLVSNAIKFSKSGQTVWMSANVVDQNQSCCCFTMTVKDQGIGISKEDQGKLFLPYVQIKPHENQNGHGSGLGLSIVKHLVELHDGKLKLVSEVGKGSEFIVTLKLPVVAMDRSQKEPQNGQNVFQGQTGSACFGKPHELGRKGSALFRPSGSASVCSEEKESWSGQRTAHQGRRGSELLGHAFRKLGRRGSALFGYSEKLEKPLPKSYTDKEPWSGKKTAHQDRRGSELLGYTFEKLDRRGSALLAHFDTLEETLPKTYTDQESWSGQKTTHQGRRDSELLENTYGKSGRRGSVLFGDSKLLEQSLPKQYTDSSTKAVQDTVHSRMEEGCLLASSFKLSQSLSESMTTLKASSQDVQRIIRSSRAGSALSSSFKLDQSWSGPLNSLKTIPQEKERQHLIFDEVQPKENVQVAAPTSSAFSSQSPLPKQAKNLLSRSSHYLKKTTPYSQQGLDGSISFSNFSILVVDDSELNRKMTSMILTKQGFKVDEAGDGVEAVQKAKENQHDLILMDNFMPFMTGIEAAREISTFSQVPIVGLTGNCLDDDVEEFRSAGALVVLFKPCGKTDLLSTVHDVLCINK